MTPPDLAALQAAFGPYARFVPGFAFLHGLAAGGQPAPDVPPLTQWVAPVFDVDELERRIRDLKAVHLWLENNARALQATIQALEVQKMTLATLKGMNVSLSEVARALTATPAPAPATPDAEPAPTAPEPEQAAPDIDPVRWWRSLTDQFQIIAANAVQEMSQQAATAAAAMAANAAQASTASVPAPAAAAPAARATRSRSTRAASTPSRRPPSTATARAPARKSRP